LALTFALPVAAQTPSTSDPTPAPQPKPKKVYTEDDLRKLRGGVSVVGETQKAGPATPKATPPSKNQFTGLPQSDDRRDEPPPPKEANCPSATFAYALEAVLADQNVSIGHEVWMAKLFGGTDVCRPLPSAGTLAAGIRGDFADEKGRPIHLQVTVYLDMPTTRARQQAEIDGRHFLMLYKANAWLVDFDYVERDTGHGVLRSGIQGFNLFDVYHDTSDYLPMAWNAPTTMKASGGNTGHDGILDVIAQPR
jgi:hypothetical protein